MCKLLQFTDYCSKKEIKEYILATEIFEYSYNDTIKKVENDPSSIRKEDVNPMESDSLDEIKKKIADQNSHSDL